MDKKPMELAKTEKPIRLEKLSISRGWGDGKLRGSIDFSGPKYNTTLQIDEEFCQEIIKLCGSRLVENAKHLAEKMTADALLIDMNKGDKGE
jgi:hypothetical protein